MRQVHQLSKPAQPILHENIEPSVPKPQQLPKSDKNNEIGESKENNEKQKIRRLDKNN